MALTGSDKRLWLVFGILVIVLAGLVAWEFWPESEDSENSGNDTAQSSAPSNPSPPPGETPPTVPAKNKEKSVQGAEATIRYYHEALNYLQRTGDGAPIRKVVDMEQCERCKVVIEAAENVYSQGGNVEGGAYDGVTITDQSGGAVDGDGFVFIATVTVTRDPVIVRDRDGKTIVENKERKSTSGAVQLFYDGDTWALTSLGEE